MKSRKGLTNGVLSASFVSLFLYVHHAMHITIFNFLSVEDEKQLLNCAEHRNMAYEIACKSMALLENDGVLPLKADAKVAFVGPYADNQDGKDSSITRFACTEYGDLLCQALAFYNSGEYDKAVPLWEQVLARDSYSKLAYTGIGKSLLQQEKYKEALEYFQLGEDRESYSEAFEKYRFQYMREHFTLIVVIALLALALLFVITKLRKKRGKAAGEVSHLAMLKAPIATLQELLYKKQLSVAFATAVVIAWFVLEILKFFGTGYIFNQNSVEDFNIFLPIMTTMVLYLLFVVVNWAVSALTDGKGTFRMIYCSIAYVLLSYLLTQAGILVLSQVFVLEEQAFLTFVLWTGYVWSGILLIVVLTTIHDYTIGKACVNFLLTLFGMLLLVFLLFMAVVLFEHVASLAMTIYSELTLRMETA